MKFTSWKLSNAIRKRWFKLLVYLSSLHVGLFIIAKFLCLYLEPSHHVSLVGSIYFAGLFIILIYCLIVYPKLEFSYNEENQELETSLSGWNFGYCFLDRIEDPCNEEEIIQLKRKRTEEIWMLWKKGTLKSKIEKL